MSLERKLARLMSYCYLPSNKNDGDPVGAVKVLIKTILICSLVGMLILVLKALFWKKT